MLLLYYTMLYYIIKCICYLRLCFIYNLEKILQFKCNYTNIYIYNSVLAINSDQSHLRRVKYEQVVPGHTFFDKPVNR
jgi:hypothetical protein